MTRVAFNIERISDSPSRSDNCTKGKVLSLAGNGEGRE